MRRRSTVKSSTGLVNPFAHCLEGDAPDKPGLRASEFFEGVLAGYRVAGHDSLPIDIQPLYKVFARLDLDLIEDEARYNFERLFRLYLYSIHRDSQEIIDGVGMNIHYGVLAKWCGALKFTDNHDVAWAEDVLKKADEPYPGMYRVYGQRLYEYLRTPPRTVYLGDIFAEVLRHLQIDLTKLKKTGLREVDRRLAAILEDASYEAYVHNMRLAFVPVEQHQEDPQTAAVPQLSVGVTVGSLQSSSKPVPYHIFVTEKRRPVSEPVCSEAMLRRLAAAYQKDLEKKT